MSNPKPVDSKTAMQLFLAGEVTGTAAKLDADILEAYLDSNPDGFYYMDLCRKVVDLKRAIMGRPRTPPKIESFG